MVLAHDVCMEQIACTMTLDENTFIHSKNYLMRQLLITITCCFCGLMTAVAQDVTIGAKGGLTISNWSSNFDNITSKLAFHLGGYGHYVLQDNLGLQAELLFSAAGAKSTGNPEGKINTGHLSIPLLAVYSVAEDVSLHGGLQISLLLSAKSEITSGPDSGTKIDQKDEFTSGDFALVLGGQYDINEQVSAGLRVALGLNNVATDEGDEIKNVLFQIFAAVPLVTQ